MFDSCEMELLRNNLWLGTVKKGGAYALYPKPQLLMHGLGLGRTGCGKTTWLYWLVSQLIDDDCGIWIFDRKADFRHLHRIFPEKLLVFNPTNLYCSPWKPPPYFPPKEWVGLVTDVFCRGHGLLGLGQSVLYEAANDLFEKRGIYMGGADYPSFSEMYEALEKKNFRGKRRSAESRDSLCARIKATMLANEKMWDCYSGFDLEPLTKKNVVFEVKGMLEDQAMFCINLLLYWLFAYRIGKQERGNRLRNVIVLDEARYVFSPWDVPALGFRPIVHMLAMLREFGVGIVAMDSTANLHDCIYENSQLKLLWPIGSGDSLLKAAQAMGLSPEQAAYTYSLDVGEVIVRHQVIEKTFVLQIPKFPLE